MNDWLLLLFFAVVVNVKVGKERTNKNALVSATIFVAFASYVADFAAAVARLRLVWTVSGNVTALVAIVARDVAVAIVGLIGAVASYMTGFVTVVTAWLVSWLKAIT